MKKAERILSIHLNRNRIASKGNECTDAEYYKRWKRVYPDSSKQILAAMEDYKNDTIPTSERNPKKKY